MREEYVSLSNIKISNLIMREEYVSLSNIEISNLIKEIKKYFIDLNWI